MTLPSVEPLEPRRLLSAGDADPTFGAGGIVATTYPAQWEVQNTTVMPDGKVLLTGGVEGADYSSPFQYLLARYNADGTPDTSFGDNGVVQGFLPGGDPDQGEVNSELFFAGFDGQKILAGVPGDIALVRFNADGSLDTTFAGDGTLTRPSDTIGFAAITPDGKLLFINTDSADGSYFLTRYNNDGTPDSSFGDNGVSRNTFGTNQPNGILVLPDGKILLSTNGDQVGLRRLNSDGSPDSTFNGGQPSFATVGTFDVYLNEIAVLSDGGIAVAGVENDKVKLARFNADGTFDHGVEVVLPFPADSFTTNIAADAAGGAILFASSNNGGAFNVRMDSSGNLDPAFGIVLAGNHSVGGGLLSDGKLLIVSTNANPLPAHLDPPPSHLQFVRLLGVGDTSPPDVSLDTASGVLSVKGTAADDFIEVSENLSGILASNHGVGRAFNSDDVNRIDVDAGAGDDYVSARFLRDKPAHVLGGPGRDRIAGGPMNDTLEGNAQRDRIDGGAGDDLIVGNGGNDVLRGEDGNDSLGGRRGNDHLAGGTGDDHLEAGPGRDALHGGDGNDSLAAADGEIDQLFGDTGTDSASADPDDILNDIESMTP